MQWFILPLPMAFLQSQEARSAQQEERYHDAETATRSLFYPQSKHTGTESRLGIWSLLILSNFLSKGRIIGQSATDESKKEDSQPPAFPSGFLGWPSAVPTYPHIQSPTVAL